MSLFDRILPSSALRWGKLTDRNPPPWRTWLDDLVSPPIHGVFRQAAKDEEHLRRLLAAAGPYTDANRAVRRPVDPAALWGEHDRRAEGQQ